LDTFRRWMGIATLRCLRENVVPEELKAEPLSRTSAPFIRVNVILTFYRTCSSRFTQATIPIRADALWCFDVFLHLPSHSPRRPRRRPTLWRAWRDAGTSGRFSRRYQVPLRRMLVYSVSLLSSYCWRPFSVTDIAFPRLQTIEILIHIVRQQPKLSKEASSSLIELGEAIQASAQREEIDILLRGTLYQEVYVRNSCLQALQVNPCFISLPMFFWQRLLLVLWFDWLWLVSSTMDSLPWWWRAERSFGTSCLGG